MAAAAVGLTVAAHTSGIGQRIRVSTVRMQLRLCAFIRPPLPLLLPSYSLLDSHEHVEEWRCAAPVSQSQSARF